MRRHRVPALTVLFVGATLTLGLTSAVVGGACVWEFGNMRNGNTFGGDKQYGKVGPSTLGAFASAILPNPNC